MKSFWKMETEEKYLQYNKKIKSDISNSKTLNHFKIKGGVNYE